MDCTCKGNGNYCSQLAELNKIIEAIKFYADENNYKSSSTGFVLQYEPVSSPIEMDKGKQARNLIRKLNNE